MSYLWFNYLNLLFKNRKLDTLYLKWFSVLHLKNMEINKIKLNATSYFLWSNHKAAWFTFLMYTFVIECSMVLCERTWPKVGCAKGAFGLHIYRPWELPLQRLLFGFSSFQMHMEFKHFDQTEYICSLTSDINLTIPLFHYSPQFDYSPL